MRRAILFFLILFVAGPVRAQAPARPCPYVTAGWSLPPQPPVTSVQYDETTQLLYVIVNTFTAHAFSNVPVATMQAFSRSTNYWAFYNTSVVNTFHEILLNDAVNNCPLRWENGAYLWAH